MKIIVNQLEKYFGSDLLFENINFEIDDHDKIGLVGPNGAGKTTLFKILMGEELSNDGQINIQKHVRLGYLQQHVLTDSNRSVQEEVLDVFSDLIQLEDEIESINLDIEIGNGDIEQLVKRQHALSEQFEREGGFVYKSRARAMLLGLGFSAEELDLPVHVQSGGQKTRIMLAKLLLSRSNLLLLDEPTNHLDIQAVEWLEDFLNSYEGAFIVISHDRYFLDKVTSRTFELQNGRLDTYTGNYSTYLLKKKERQKAITNAYENSMREIHRLEGIIEQQRRWNREKNIRTAESKQKMIDRIEQNLEVPDQEAEEIHFQFQSKKTGGNDVLLVNGLRKEFDHKVLFEDVSFHIRRGERIFLLGPNGCGKTTLFKLLLGEYTADAGHIKFGSNIEIGYYDQTQNELDETKTVIDEVWDCYPKMTQTEVRNACAAFLFFGDDVFKKISVLSGGERARVALLKLMLSGSNLLMLDEPTNHLDIGSREALEDAFADYEGTMFIVSHDRYFINKLAETIYELTPEGIQVYLGNYDYYLEKRGEKEKQKKQKENSAALDYKAKKEKAAAIRKLQSALKKTEDKIEQTEAELKQLEETLAVPEIASDYEKTLELSSQISQKQQELDDLYESWDSLSEEVESTAN